MPVRRWIRNLSPAFAVDAARRARDFRRMGFTRFAATTSALSPRYVRAHGVLSLALFPSLPRPVECVVDVGGFRGEFADALGLVLRPQRLHVFEADPDAASLAGARLAGRAGVEVHPVAVGDSTGVVTLHRYSRPTNNSLLRAAAQRDLVPADLSGAGASVAVDTVEVPLGRLDDLLPETTCPTVSLLKIDVQGMEAAVLRGARSLLARTRAVFLEMAFEPQYEGMALFGELDASLRSSGFALYDVGNVMRGLSGRALQCDASYVRFAGP
jgi:FkbM family methyltransferase